MTTILVVDDSPLEQRRAGALLEENGWDVIYATNGRAALQDIDQSLPQLVLTDLIMPEMNGLELVRQIRDRNIPVPIILMTAHGSEDIAARALQMGATSYVPKKNLGEHLVPTVQNVLALAKKQSEKQRVRSCIASVETNYVLGLELDAIPALVAHLQEELQYMSVCDERDLVRVGTALHEALVNAVEHGNLEITSEQRQNNYHKIVEQRRQQTPFRDRRVHVHARVVPGQATYIIRDEGPGFDPQAVPDPLDPENLEKLSGRGLLLIRMFMDDVQFNDRGNQITLTKRCAG
jgi:CheY-like chemotaxis protein/anti-sigma regulatory factor (Ser/Thr protein kinase)